MQKIIVIESNDELFLSSFLDALDGIMIPPKFGEFKTYIMYDGDGSTPNYCFDPDNPHPKFKVVQSLVDKNKYRKGCQNDFAKPEG